MSETDTSKVKEYINKVTAEAEDLVLNVFPKKIIELNSLLDKPPFRNLNLDDAHSELNIPIPDPIVLYNTPSKKRKVDDIIESNGKRAAILPVGGVPTNQKLTDAIQLVKPHICELIKNSSLLKMWIQYLIPKIEDGDNFGVSVQEETLGEIQSVETEVSAYLDQLTRYYTSRGKLISKVAKYPHVEDYRMAVDEIDEKQYFSMWLMLSEIRNRYGILHDLILKNMDKIKKPRSLNSQNMY